MQKPLDTILPGNLPEDWELGQAITPDGIDSNFEASERHGYNYQSKQINNAHKAINELNDAFEGAQENLETIATDTVIADTDTVPTVKTDNTKKRVSFLTIVNTIKAKFNAVYAALVHTHGNITNGGNLGTAANQAAYTTTDGKLIAGTLPVAAGGTGKASFTSGQVLVGNGTGAIGQKAIDTTVGGTKDSTALITSGAVKGALPPTIAISGAATGTATPFTGSAMNIPVTSLDATKLNGTVPVANGGTGVPDLNVNKLPRGNNADPGWTIYLSPSGNDNNTGFDANSAMKTIRGAVAKYGGLNRLQLNLANGTYTDSSTTTLNISGNLHIIISGSAAASVIIAHPIIFQSTNVKLYRVTFDLTNSTASGNTGVTLRQCTYDIQECVFKGKVATNVGINVSLGTSGYVLQSTFQSLLRAVEVGSGASMTALNCTVSSEIPEGFHVNGGLFISGNNTNNAGTKFTMYNSAVIFNDGISLNAGANVVATAEVE